MTPFHKKIILISGIIVILILVFFYLKPPAFTKQTPPVVVNVSSVFKKNVTIDATAIGNVRAYSSVNVKSQVEGTLLSVHFNEGEMVKEGQLLFTIDPRPFQIAIEQAEANLKKDEAQLKTASLSMNRNQKLIAKGYVSAQEFDALKNNVAALSATVLADKAALETAKLQLSYSTIKAPISGKTGEQLIEPGNLVRINDEALVVINQLQPISIVFTLPEEQLEKIRQAFTKSAVDVFISPDKSKDSFSLKAKLVFIDNKVDQTTGSIQLKADFVNEKLELWPGQFVKIKIPLVRMDDALLVPTQAVQEGPNGSYVFAIGKKNIVHIVPVKTIHTVDNNTIIQSSLKPGVQVVTVGQLQLRDGTEVQPILENNP